MKVIGLTGSFGTGKTFVASVFKSLGARVIDADLIAHRVIRKNSRAYKKIVRAFGKDILTPGTGIDRKKLGKSVFEKKSYLKRLNEIVHPEVIKLIKKKIKEAGEKDIVVVDAPLLLEAKAGDLVDKIVVVKASERNQLNRCAEKFRMNKRDILKRIRGQIPIEKKIKIADFVIDNNGTKSETRAEVKKIWRKVWR